MATPPLFCDYGSYLARFFPFKVQKLSIDGGFACPNRDGTIGRGGCTYCNNEAFVPAYCRPEDSIAVQLQKGKDFFRRKYPDMHFLAYFQAHTNTYAPLKRLLAAYREALCVDGVVGLVVGTRPDCVSDELLDSLAELSRTTYIMIEYGVESTDDARLRRVNRGHTFAQAADAVRRTAARGLQVAAHIILGLPGDTPLSILQQATTLSLLPLNVLKLHQLQIVRGTSMATDYALHPKDYAMLMHRPEDYALLLSDFLPRLRSDLVVERFTSQTPDALLLAPRWGMKNHAFVDLLRRTMASRGTYQGQYAAVQSL